MTTMIDGRPDHAPLVTAGPEAEAIGPETGTARGGTLSDVMMAAGLAVPGPAVPGQGGPAVSGRVATAGADPAAAGSEVELKLGGDRLALEAAFAGPALAGRATAPARARLQTDTYYDTAAGILAARGAVLRIRDTDGTFIQTLKTAAAPGGAPGGDPGGRGPVRRRGEWETRLPTLHPDPLAFSDPAARALLDGIDPARLAPRFTVEVDRRVMTVEGVGVCGGRMRIEAAMDIGRIVTSAGDAPISELELELKWGGPSDVYRLGLDLNDGTGLRIATRSKADRAHDLLLRRPPPWEKALKPVLPDGATVAQALESVVRTCVGQWLANHDASVDGRDPEGVHQLRVALRRLRTALAMFRPAIAAHPAEPIEAEVTWALRAVGPARDWDVFIRDLLAPVIAARPDDPGLTALAAAAEDARADAYRAARAVLGSQRYTRTLLRLGQWVEDQGWRVGADPAIRAAGDAPLTGLAGALLRKRHNKVLKRGRAFGRLDTDGRHAVRKRLKHLRYGVEFFAGLYPARKTRPYLKALAGLQDRLGHLNDVAVAEALLGDLVTAHGRRRHARDVRLGAGLVLGWHARGVADDAPRIVADWTRFAAARPFWSKG